jgi:hypothetical protein
MFMTKSDLGAHISSLRTWKNKLTNKFNRIDTRLLTNCMRNSHKSLDPFFMKFSASMSGTKKNVQGGCHGCWQTTTEKKAWVAALKFLERYHRDWDRFLDHIVTGDETWDSHFTPESKRQSLVWHHARSPSKPRKFKQTLSTRKIMATVFGGRNL